MNEKKDSAEAIYLLKLSDLTSFVVGQTSRRFSHSNTAGRCVSKFDNGFDLKVKQITDHHSETAD